MQARMPPDEVEPQGDREGLPYIFTCAQRVGETLAVSLLLV